MIMKKLLILFGLLLAFPAFAADNAVIVTPGTGVTMKSKDIGAGVQAMQPVISDASGNALSTPTAGADAASNTATGLAVYNRPWVWNGTTWDRAPGTTGGAYQILRDAAGNARGANVDASNRLTTAPTFISGSVASGAVASGAIASGAVASGAVASGAYASGSIASGAMVDLGTTADAACATDNGTCTVAALIKRTNQNVTTATTTSVPAGSAIIGKVTTDQTTHGTTDLIAADLTKIAGVAAVADPCQTATKAFTSINVVTATNTIITGVAAKKKYICGIFLYPAGTDNIAIFQATTATSCATALVGVIGGTTTATGIVATAQAGFVLGNGASAVAATTVNQTDLCIVTSAAVQLSGVVVTVDQ